MWLAITNMETFPLDICSRPDTVAGSPRCWRKNQAEVDEIHSLILSWFGGYGPVCVGQSPCQGYSEGSGHRVLGLAAAKSVASECVNASPVDFSKVVAGQEVVIVFGIGLTGRTKVY
jgi:hypothetical protein